MKKKIPFSAHFGAFLILFFSVFWLPAWVTFVLALLPLIMLRNYAPFFVIVLLLDLLYGITTTNAAFFDQFFYTTLGFFVYIAIFFIKKRLFMYRK